jgi:hypothetical protein
VNAKQLKIIAATIGSGALLSMGALAAAASGMSSADSLRLVPLAPEVKTVETSTPDVVATPPITTPPYTIPTGEPQ